MSKIREKQEQIKQIQSEIREMASSMSARAGERILLARKSNKMTQEELADIMGLSRTQIVNLETGKGHLTIVNLLILCDVFETTPNDLLGYEEPYD